MKVNDIEFRWNEINSKWELARWYKTDDGEKYGCVIAFFDFDKEGYKMRTVGNRFFEAGEDAFFVGKHAMNFLQGLFEKEKNESAYKNV